MPREAGWICSKCGGGGCNVLESRPSLDDRFAIGHCPRCTPQPGLNAKNQKRGTVTLIRPTDASRQAIADRDRARSEARVVRKVAGERRRRKDGSLPPEPTQQEIEAANDALRRWQAEAAARHQR